MTPSPGQPGYPRPERAAGVPGSPAAAQIEGLRPWLTRYVAARIGDAHEAEDVVQEVLLALASGPCPDPADLAAWAVGIARHKTADWWRGTMRRPAVPCSELPDAADPAADPAVHAERTETVAYVRSLLSRLPERDADLLLLRMSGCTAEEAGAALRMSPVAVRVAQHRALGRLRRGMGRSDEQAWR